MPGLTVAFVCHSKEVGGAEVHLLDLMTFVQHSGAGRALLICRTDAALDDWVARVAASGVDVARLDLRGLSDYDVLRRRFRSADLVHVMLAYPIGKYQLVSTVAARLARRSVIATHHLPLDIDALPIPAGKRALWSRLFRQYGRLAQRHIAISRSGRDLLVGRYGFPASSVDVIYTGVDPGQFQPLSDAAREEVRAALGAEVEGEAWKPPTQLVTTVARLSLQKGLDDLVSAAEQVVQRQSGARFLIVGEGDERVELTRRIERRGLVGHVHLLGQRPPQQVARVLAASDLFVLPSHFEGIPLALLEAMAAGCPVVATGVGGVPEVVADASLGILVATRQPAELARAILTLLDQPEQRAAMGAAGRQRVISGFDRKAGLARTVTRYADLVKRKAG